MSSICSSAPVLEQTLALVDAMDAALVQMLPADSPGCTASTSDGIIAAQQFADCVGQLEQYFLSLPTSQAFGTLGQAEREVKELEAEIKVKDAQLLEAFQKIEHWHASLAAMRQQHETALNYGMLPA